MVYLHHQLLRFRCGMPSRGSCEGSLALQLVKLFGEDVGPSRQEGGMVDGGESQEARL